MNTSDRKVRPVTPGEILGDILEDIEMSISEFAELSGISFDDLSAIIENKKTIAQDTALAIGKALGTSSRLWLDLQSKIDDWDERQRAIG